MRSDTIKISTTGEGIAEALRQAEAVAVYKGLSSKETLQLRLLAEEMMGMFRGLTEELEAEFYIEDKDGAFEMHLKTPTEMNADKRKKLLEASTSGKNEAAVGVTGKIRSVFESLFEPEKKGAPRYIALGLVSDPVAASTATWSLRDYRDAVRDDAEAWDELESSIVAKVADEVKVGIRGGYVEMVIYKIF